MVIKQNSSVIRPFADEHAIVEVSFGFEWNEPLSQDLFTKLSALHESVEKEFPVKREIRQGISVDVTGADGPNAEPPAPRNAISTILLDYVEGKDNLVRQIIIDQERLVFNDFGKYDRWTVVRDQALSWLLPFLDVIFSERTLRVVGLQYLDAFEIITDMPVAPQIFEQTDLLPRGIFEREGAWHIHQGYFTELAAPVGVMLTNLNIRVFSVDQERQILEVRASHRAHLNDDVEPKSERLSGVLDVLHSENKSLLSNILLPKIKQAIKLDNQEL